MQFKSRVFNKNKTKFTIVSILVHSFAVDIILLNTVTIIISTALLKTVDVYIVNLE